MFIKIFGSVGKKMQFQCIMLSIFPCRCYTFAEMPWYQRRIAKVLFANPPSSTYEEVV